MPKLNKLTYQDWDGRNQVLDFIGSQPPSDRFHTTILTGHNGSHKSTILRELVSALAVPEYKSSLTLFPSSIESQGPVPVICASGSVADRFPSKENAGRRTEFDVPNYVYIGQRVGVNLLSKKRPLETAVAFALDESVHERFEWPFYERAYQLAGIVPQLDLEFRRKATSRKERDLSTRLLEFVQAKSGDHELSKDKGRSMSKPMAQYLTTEFTYDAFTELESALSGKGRGAIRVTLSHNDLHSSHPLSLEAIRLGLLTDELTLVDARVTSRRRNRRYSVFDLSSGEYHMLTTIIGLGFSVRDGAVLLIDEPENSLHPQWQQDFMDTLFEICAFMRDGHVVISTHSPLIVSSAQLGTTVVDLSRSAESALVNSFRFGASADDILFEQFGIASSRNRYVVDLVQRAIALTESGHDNEVKSMSNELYRLRKLLRTDDPLADVIDALLEEEA